jgi:hypothetical protein
MTDHEDWYDDAATAIRGGGGGAGASGGGLLTDGSTRLIVEDDVSTAPEGDTRTVRLDDFARVVDPPSWEAGDSITASITERPASKGVNVDGVAQSFTLAAGGVAKVGSYVGDWYKTISAPDYACSYPEGDFRGWWDREVWGQITIPAHPTGMAGATVTVKGFGADGSGYGAGGLAATAGLDVVVMSSQPTDTWQGTPVGHIPVDDADHDVFVPGSLIPAAGGSLWVGVRAGWSSEHDSAGPYCSFPLWPYDSGIGNSGKCLASISGAAWATWIVEGDSLGSLVTPDEDGPWEGGNAWQDAGTEGSPTSGIDGQGFYVTSESPAGRGIRVVGDLEDDEEAPGPWSDRAAIRFEFDLDATGSLVAAGTRSIEMTVIGEGLHLVGTIHLGDTGHAPGIGVHGGVESDYAAVTLTAGDRWVAIFDPRSGSFRGKVWRVIDGEPAEWQVECDIAETDDHGDSLTFWLRAGNGVGSEQTVRLLSFSAVPDASGMWVDERLGLASGTTNRFGPSHQYVEGTLRYRVSGVVVPPASEDGGAATGTLDAIPTAGMHIWARYLAE